MLAMIVASWLASLWFGLGFAAGIVFCFTVAAPVLRWFINLFESD